MVEILEKLTKEFIDSFSKSILPIIENQIDDRDNAFDRVDKLVKRAETLNQEIANFNNEIEHTRREAATSDNHEKPMTKIVKLKDQIKVLQEIKEEIETKTLPSCRNELEKKQEAVQKTTIMELNKICEKERGKLINLLISIQKKTDAFQDARVEFSDMLKLPSKYHLSSSSDLYIDGLRSLDLT
jgi:hypothetical protein